MGINRDIASNASFSAVGRTVSAMATLLALSKALIALLRFTEIKSEILFGSVIDRMLLVRSLGSFLFSLIYSSKCSTLA